MSVTALNRAPVYNARPMVEVDGQRFDKLNELLLAMEMREQEGGLSAMELRLSNVASDPDGSAAYAFEDEREIRFGSSITVFAGDVREPQELFRGMVTGLEADFPEGAPPELLVLAEDKLQQARMARRSHSYRDMSVADIANEIAQRLSLQARVTGLTSPTGTWVQFNESDLAFLRRLLRRIDADLQIVEDRLEIAPVSEMQRQVIQMEMFHDLRSVRFIADLAHQVSEVTCAGWNPVAGQAVSGRGSGVNLGPGQGRRGFDLLRDAVGDRSEHVGHIPVTTDEEAQALADTVFDQRARGFVCAEGTAGGHPNIRVGSHLQLGGVSARFENTYYVVSTHHRYDVRSGYLTDFKAESSALGEAS
ncbi:MAG: contractile injection system protein, VgrG/Pvc8 family [Gammaproteobacteria bacterium]|nr:contractile injection system protein, VgrG/Pvc8 family [Gammaproteobacteria bacterium]